MLRRFLPTIGLLVGLAPAMAHAQTNIDQGKTPAQIFANDCATCHKAPRGLARGKNSQMLAGFLREHYTASREQAASLAAYVLGAGGDSAPATPARGQKPGTDQARAPVEEPKPATRPTRQTAKPEGSAPTTAKLQPPAEEEPKLEDQPKVTDEPSSALPGRRPPAARRELQPATATRGRRKEPEAAPSALEPTTVIAQPSGLGAPVPDGSPAQTPGPSAAAPANADTGDGEPVPRDNIPD